MLSGLAISQSYNQQGPSLNTWPLVCGEPPVSNGRSCEKFLEGEQSMIEVLIIERIDGQIICSDLFSILTDSEREHILRYRTAEDQHNSLIGIILTRYILQTKSDYFGPIKHHPNGKPYIDHLSGGDISISHSNRWIACTFNPSGKVGVDIEEIRDVDFTIAMEFLSSKEADYFRAFTSKKEKLITLFKFWTLKESFIKASGTGMLNVSLSSIEFDLSGDPVLKSQAKSSEQYAFYQELYQSYCLSLSYSSAENTVVCPQMITLADLTGYFSKK
jgi:4'-phosphopantetheinyl transferase